MSGRKVFFTSIVGQVREDHSCTANVSVNNVIDAKTGQKRHWSLVRFTDGIWDGKIQEEKLPSGIDIHYIRFCLNEAESDIEKMILKKLNKSYGEDYGTKKYDFVFDGMVFLGEIEEQKCHKLNRKLKRAWY